MNQKDPAPSAPTAAQPHSGNDSLRCAFLDAAKVHWDKLDDALKATGLSRAKMEVLHQLVQAGDPVSLRVLAQGQDCVPSNMTALIDRLQSDGLVQRVPSPDDRRSVRAALTRLGKERAAEGTRIVADVEAAFDAAVPPNDRAALARALTALRAA